MPDEQIDVSEVDPNTFHVEVTDGGSTSAHTVKVPAGVGVPGATDVEMVEESFRFLLEREPKEQILDNFDLPMIARYFPDYREEMRRRLG